MEYLVVWSFYSYRNTLASAGLPVYHSKTRPYTDWSTIYVSCVSIAMSSSHSMVNRHKCWCSCLESSLMSLPWIEFSLLVVSYIECKLLSRLRSIHNRGNELFLVPLTARCRINTFCIESCTWLLARNERYMSHTCQYVIYHTSCIIYHVLTQYLDSIHNRGNVLFWVPVAESLSACPFRSRSFFLRKQERIQDITQYITLHDITRKTQIRSMTFWVPLSAHLFILSFFLSFFVATGAFCFVSVSSEKDTRGVGSYLNKVP